MRWLRPDEQAPTEATAEYVSFRRVGAIRPVGPDGTIRAYTTRDLRARLAVLSVALTRMRKMVAMLPIMVALVAFAVIPSYAAAPRTAAGTGHTVANPRVVPADVPGAQQGPISSGPISVVPPKGTTPSKTLAATPKTGAGDGIMRTSIVGLCLLLSGLVLLTAPRRNPHAEAEWREARARRPAPA